MVHEMLELFFVKYEEDLDGYVKNIIEKTNKKYLDEIKELKLTEDEEKELYEDCLAMITQYMTLFKIKLTDLVSVGKAQNNRHAFYLLKPKFREKWFEDAELRLCGFMDRIHKDWDGYVTIGDYKTSSRFGIGIKGDYEIQSAIYALLYKRWTGKIPDYTSVIFLRYGEEVRTRVTPSQIQYALDLVKEVHEKSKTDKIENYPKREGKLCKWCNYFDECSGIKKVETEIRRKKFVKKIKTK